MDEIMDALTFDQIRVFLSVVDQGSFPKAAKSLKRAQSAVTYAIRKLEAEIGVQLFDRSGYRSVLTPAGRALLTRRSSGQRQHSSRRRTAAS
jgi:DNA-binding transcriptional LysR family regulator